MAITVTSGCDTIPQRPSPWDEAGVMSTYLPAYQRLFEWIATPRFNMKHCECYYASAGSTSVTLPPMPLGAPRQIMVSHSDKVSSIYGLRPNPGGYWTQSSVTTSTSWVDLPHTYATLASGRWNSCRINVTAASAWGTTTGLTISVRSTEPAPTAAGYGAAVYGGYNSTLNYAHMTPCIPMGVPDTLSSAHYNAIVRQVERSLVCPVLHAGYCGAHTVSTVSDILANRIIPIMVRRDAPPEQRRVSFVFVSNTNQESNTWPLVVRRGDIVQEISHVWTAGGFLEYRWSMDPFMDGGPDIVVSGRDVYYLRLESEIKDKLYSYAVWGGLYEPV